MEKLILYGGSFDPVHNGHLRMANAASFLLNADVVFIPSKNPRWKDPAEDIKHRLRMLRLAIKQSGMSGSIISNYELKSTDDINYTIDTVKYFVEKHPQKKFYLLIGADQVNQFHQWRAPKEISELVKIVYIQRPQVEVNLDNVKKYNMSKLNYDLSGAVSSRDIRNLNCLDLPSTVLDYIEKHRLYFFNKLETILPPARFQHSISVARLALKIAFHNRLKIEREAYIAGLLHDLAKGLDQKVILEIMKEEYQDYLHLPPFSYHQFVGVYLAKKVFNIQDEKILDAVQYHATGKANMSDLGKIIYCADKIDPLRKFNSASLIKKCYENFETGFLHVLKANKEYLLSINKDINNELTKSCMDYYLKKGY